MELNLSAPNSQSFDDVLQKLKQSMKAARSGGWIDSDSGSELEVALDHTPNGNTEGLPCRRASVTRSTNKQHALYIKDGPDQRRGEGEDRLHTNPASLWNYRKTINPRVPDLSHLKTRPLTACSLRHHSVDPTSVSYPQDPRVSPLFDAPTDPYVPRTPSTPASIGTSAGSPYVRHHFKWEYLPPSTTGEELHLPGSQPRFVESSSPPLKINHDAPYPDWSRGFLSKEFIFPTDSAQAQSHGDARYNFEFHAPRGSPNVPSGVVNGYRSASYSPAHSKSQPVLPHNVGAGYNPRMSGLENIPTNVNSLKTGSLEPPQKPWLSAPPPQEAKLRPQTLLNPASVSSVSFSLAPAAPIRLTAPEGESPLESFERKGISRSPGEINPQVTSRESNSMTSHAPLSASASSASLRDLAQEKEKEVIRARLMGSSSIDSFQTKLQNLNKPTGGMPAPINGDHAGQFSNLPSLFQQMRFSNTTQTITSSQAPVNSTAEITPLRSISTSYPAHHTYCAPIFYSSHPHGAPTKQTSFAVTSSASSSPNDIYAMGQLTPRTPIAPIGFSPNAHLHAPSSGMPYPPTPSVNKSPFVPVIVPAVPGIGGAVGTPLPGQVQPEEVRKSVKAQPPVVNTGNSGAMIPQPGDWMCICGFVNWRRRKVCMRCFPFADGNDSVGAMMALNAQRAALLAAGIPMTKDHSNSTSSMSNSSPMLFQSSETPSYPEMGKQTVDQKVKFNRIFSSPEPVFNYGRLVEPTGIFASQAQGMAVNPFDKPSPLGPISPAAGRNPHNSSDGETRERYLERSPQRSLDRAAHVDFPIDRPERSPRELRARLVAPGEEQQSERNPWGESTLKSPRPRSFSMGAKSVWESNDEIRNSGVPEARNASNSSKIKQNPIGKLTNGILGSEEGMGGQTVNDQLVPDRHQEINTISSNGANLNRQRTITSPTSSWQAIKALWQ